MGAWISLGAMLASFASWDEGGPPPTDMQRLVWGIGRTLACTGVPLSLGVLAAWIGLVADMRRTMEREVEGTPAGGGGDGHVAP
jgi:hypothetical protein